MAKRLSIFSLLCMLIATSALRAQHWEWAKAFANANGNAEGIGIGRDNSGNIYVCGNYNGSLQAGNLSLSQIGGQDIFLAKLDSLGNVIWLSRAGGTATDQVADMKVSAAGDIYLAGTFQNAANLFGTVLTSLGHKDMFVAKINTNGLLVWVRSGGSNDSPVNSVEASESIAIDAQQNVYVTGVVEDNASASFGGVGLPQIGQFSNTVRYVVRYNTNGALIWVRVAPYSFQNSAIAVDAQNNYWVTYAPNFLNSSRIFAGLSKYSVNNSFLLYADSSDLFERTSLATFGSNAIYKTNNFNVPSRTIGNLILNSNGGRDGVLIKYNIVGVQQWVRQIGGAGNDLITTVVTNSLGDVFTTGSFNNTAVFDTITLQAAGTQAFVAKFNDQGKIDWVINGGSGNGDVGNAIVANTKGEAFVTGRFSGSAQFGDLALQSSGFSDVFVGKIGCKPDKPINLSHASSCTGQVIVYANNPDRYSLIWNGLANASLLTANSDSAIFQVSNAGNVSISCTPANSCGRGPSDTLVFTAISSPAKPMAITGDSVVCAGNHAYSTLANTGVNYHWQSTSGTLLSLGNSVVLSNNSSGSITLSVQATNACGTSAPTTKQIIVQAPITQAPSLSGNTTSCATSQNYTATLPTNGTGINWNLSSGGVLASNGQQATVQWSQTGNHNLTVSATNSCGTGPFQSVNVQVNDVPALPSLQTGNLNPCPGLSSYQLQSSANTNYFWNLSGGGGLISNGAAASIIWNNSGVHTLTAVGQNQCGFSDSLVLVIEVQTAPATPDTIYGADTACLGLVTYTTNSQNGVQYQWSLSGGGLISPLQNTATVNWLNPGVYQLSIAAQNQCGISGTYQQTVVVDTLINPFTGIAGSVSSCLDTSVYAVNMNTGSAWNWQLSGGGILQADSNTALVNWTQSGLHYLSVQNESGCGFGMQVSVSDLPAQPQSITGSTQVCTGTNAFTAPQQPNTTYQWSSSSGNAIFVTPTGENAFVNFTSTGVDTLKIIASNTCGSSTPEEILISVSQSPIIQPIAFDSVVCVNTTSALSVGLDSSAQYTWNTSGGNLFPQGANASVFWPSLGLFNVNVVAQNQCGNSSPYTFTIEVIEPALPPDSIIGSKAVCLGQQLLSIDTASGQQYTWLINKGGSITGNGKVAAVNWQNIGMHTVAVIPSNRCGTGAIVTKNIRVSGVPEKPRLDIGDTLPCIGLNSYKVVSDSAQLFFWSLPGGGSVSSFNDSCTVNWSNVGVYLLRSVPFNQCGFGPAIDINIRAQTVPSSPSITGDTAVCAGIAQYNVPFLPGENYIWNISGGGILNSNTTSAQVQWLSNGTHQLSAIAQNKCGFSATATHDIEVNSVPFQPQFNSADTLPCLGNQTYSVNAFPNAQYAWTSNFKSDTGSQFIVNLNLTGLDTLSVYGFNECGISATTTLPIEVIAAPNSNLSLAGDTTACVGDAKVYLTQSTGPYNQLNWNAGANALINQAADSAILSFIAQGNVNLSVYESNKCGQGPLQTKLIRVLNIPQIGNAINGNSVGCVNQADTFTVSGSSGTSYLWALNGGGSLTNATESARIQWQSPGNYIVSVSPFNQCGVGSTSFKTIQVNDVPSKPFILDGDSLVCVGTTFYRVNAFGATQFSWSADSAMLVISQGNSASVQFGSQGSYHFMVAAENQCGVSDSLKIEVEVIDVPQQAGAITGDTLSCPVASTYTVSPVGGEVYTWQLSSGGSLNGNNQTALINWTSPGQHQILATARNQCGAGAQSVLTVTIDPLPSDLTSIIGSSTLCVGDTNEFTTNLQANVDYTWRTTGPAFLLENNHKSKVVWSRKGVFTVEAWPSNGCGTALGAALSIEVIDAPDISGNILGNTETCVGNTEGYQLPNDNETLYAWSTTDSMAELSSIGSATLVKWNTVGKRNITANAFNQCGSSTAALDIRVDENPKTPEVYYRNDSLLVDGNFPMLKWYLNGSELLGNTSPWLVPTMEGNYTAVSVNSCGDSEKSNAIRIGNANDVLVYPNPASSLFTVLIPTESGYTTLQLLDALGKLMGEYEVENRTQLVFNNPNLQKGIYFLRLSGVEQSNTVKLVIGD